MMKQLKQYLEQRRIKRSRSKVAQMIVTVAKGRRIIDTAVVGYRTERNGFVVDEVADSYGSADGILWPSREGVAIPVEAIYKFRTDGVTVHCKKH